MNGIEIFNSLAFPCGVTNKMIIVSIGDIIEIELYSHSTKTGKLLEITEDFEKGVILEIDCSKKFTSMTTKISGKHIKYIDVVKGRYSDEIQIKEKEQ